MKPNIIVSEKLTVNIEVLASSMPKPTQRAPWVMEATNPELIEMCKAFIPHFNKYKAKARRIKRVDLMIEFSMMVMKLQNIMGVLQSTNDESAVNRNSLRIDLKHCSRLISELTDKQ